VEESLSRAISYSLILAVPVFMGGMLLGTDYYTSSTEKTLRVLSRTGGTASCTGGKCFHTSSRCILMPGSSKRII